MEEEFETINNALQNLQLQSIREKELYQDMGNFDFIPKQFYNIDTSTFGTSLRDKNSFLELKKVASNTEIPFVDRAQSIRYMQRIPRFDKYQHINECIKSILDDNNIPFNERFLFISNNERITKLDHELVNYSHSYICNSNFPLMYKILSSQYVLTYIPHSQNNLQSIQEFLYSVSSDKNQNIHYRSECADILSRNGYNEWKEKGKQIIQELGESFEIYENKENVHDVNINQQLSTVLKYLIETTDINSNTEEIYEELLREEQSDTLLITAFQRIMFDTSVYDGKTLLDVLLLVWEQIKISQYKDELIKRLKEELIEMDKTCSSGHLARLLNVLNGYIDIPIIKISFEQQLRSNIFASIKLSFKQLSKQEVDIIMTEMTQDDKPTIFEFLNRFSLKDILYNEFKQYMSSTEFNNVYEKAIKDFFGLKYL